MRARMAFGAALGMGIVWPVGAQMRVNPTGVSVNAMGATTVFLTFGGMRTGVRAAESLWCGELIPAAPDRGNRCDPATIYGRLPARYDLARVSGVAGFSDIMSIPASVARRAYQDARNGARSTFFYVRRFEDVAGGPDEFVAVTCRLTGGGAHVPFSLTDVQVAFDGDDQVKLVNAGDILPPFRAVVAHNGTGRLRGRWEVVMPGDDGPARDDLLPEASLPAERRGQQRRYSQLQRFDLFVPPGGRVTLPGPDPARLPTGTEGTYLVLLRIEASDDREGDSDLAAAGTGNGVVHSGAVAGFPMPVLRYVVIGPGGLGTHGTSTRFAPLVPGNGMAIRPDSTVRLAWSRAAGAVAYLVELESASGKPLFGALVPHSATTYDVPAIPWRAGDHQHMRWRVTALDNGGRVLRRTDWRQLTAPAAVDR